jgi:hypothetical protein
MKGNNKVELQSMIFVILLLVLSSCGPTTRGINADPNVISQQTKVEVKIDKEYSPIDTSYTFNNWASHQEIHTFIISGDSSLTERYEEGLILAGYNVITRAALQLILSEHKLALSGLSENPIEIGQLVGAQAILDIRGTSYVNSLANFIIMMNSDKIKIISVESGEVFMMGSITYTSNIEIGSQPSGARGIAHLEGGDVYSNWPMEVLRKYHRMADEFRKSNP